MPTFTYTFINDRNIVLQKLLDGECIICYPGPLNYHFRSENKIERINDFVLWLLVADGLVEKIYSKPDNKEHVTITFALTQKGKDHLTAIWKEIADVMNQT